MKIAVTGANGFVGQALCETLIQQGHSVSAITRSPHVISGSNSLVIPDLCDQESGRKALAGHQALIHLAARTHHTEEQGLAALERYRKDNVEASIALAKAALDVGISRFVYISSIKVNGNSTQEQAFSHSSSALPEDAYGQSKYEAEKALQELTLDSDMELVIIRPPLIYGENIKGNLALLEKAVRHYIPLPFANLHNKRDLLALPNLCDLISTCLTHDKAAGQVFLAADGHPLSTPQLIQLIAKKTDQRPILLPFPVTLLKFIGKVCGKQAQIERLTGNLEVDINHTCEILQWRPPQTPSSIFKK